MKPQKNRLVAQVICVAIVAAVMLPFGHVIYPFMADAVGGLAFNGIEAVVTAALGYGLYVTTFG